MILNRPYGLIAIKIALKLTEKCKKIKNVLHNSIFI